MALLLARRALPRLALPSLRPCSTETTGSRNDTMVQPRMNNRNPLNLEKMRVGRKPTGWALEEKSRKFWNKLELEISNSHTTAVVTHWTGRVVARASTQEWCIRQFLYNLTDEAALRVVGQVISERCLETGVSEMVLLVDKEDMQKEKMVKFISVIEEAGLSLQEPEQFEPFNRHRVMPSPEDMKGPRVKPWEVLEEPTSQ